MKALDTNVLIGFFRNPNAGCRTRRQRSDLASFLKVFERPGRMLTPSHACCGEARQVLARIGADGLAAAKRRRLTNDVLIAVTAVHHRTVVITGNNTKDFSRIEKHTPVR